MELVSIETAEEQQILVNLLAPIGKHFTIFENWIELKC